MKIFISYSHKDARLKDKLETHLSPLEDAAPVKTWTDTSIGAGQDWQAEIDRALTEAAVAVLLVTADFLASKFIKTEEAPKILTRRKEEGLRVFSVIAKPCAWKLVSWLNSMQVLPRDAQPVWRSSGRHADAELTFITEEIAEVVKAEDLKRRAKRQSSAEKARAEQAIASKLERVGQAIQQKRAGLLHYEKLMQAYTEGQKLQMESLQTDADRQKWQMERWKILQDTQTQIFQIQEDIAANKALTQDRAYKKWDEYIRA